MCLVPVSNKYLRWWVSGGAPPLVREEKLGKKVISSIAAGYSYNNIYGRGCVILILLSYCIVRSRGALCFLRFWYSQWLTQELKLKLNRKLNLKRKLKLYIHISQKPD